MTVADPKTPNLGAGDDAAPRSQYHQEIRLEAGGGDAALDWEAALRELEQSAPQPAAPKAPATPANEKTAVAPSPQRPTELNLYDQIRKRATAPPAPTITADDLRTLDELAEILASVNGAMTLLDAFDKHHPGAVAERTSNGWRHNLKETASIMLREFHTLRHGKQAKTYDPRCVCTSCHTVALFPLPDGLCDECRGKAARTGGEY